MLHCMHGKALSVGDAAARMHMACIGKKVLKFAFCYVWNADEFDQFYRPLLKWTLTNTAIPGKNYDKYSLTFYFYFFLYCNLNGSETFLLVIIGKPQRPTLLIETFGRKPGLDCCKNKNHGCLTLCLAIDYFILIATLAVLMTNKLWWKEATVLRIIKWVCFHSKTFHHWYLIFKKKFKSTTSKRWTYILGEKKVLQKSLVSFSWKCDWELQVQS